MTSTEQLVDRARRPRARVAHDGIGLGLVTAVVSAVGVWSCWRLFVLTNAGQRVDQAVLLGAVRGRTMLWPVAQQVLDVVSVAFIALMLLAAVLIAALRRRWLLALQVAVLMGGANLTTQLLKDHVFDRPAMGQGGGHINTLPSGHTTAAASVSAALVLVVPPRARPWAAFAGAVYTAATGVSTLIGQWHRPSDVIAGVLVVLAWSGLACALVATGVDAPAAGTSTGALRQVSGRRSRSLMGVALLAGIAVVAALPGLAALRSTWSVVGRVSTRAELLTAYAGGVFGVVAATFGAFAVLLAVRRSAGRAHTSDARELATGVHPA